MLDTVRFIALMNTLYPVWTNASRVQRAQQRRFRHLLKHANQNSPFWRRRFSGLDLDTCELSDLPTLTKAEMMANFDECVTDPAIKLADAAHFMEDPSNLGKLYLGRYPLSHTSGSQGQPAVIVQDQHAAMLTFALQIARGAPLTPKYLPHVDRLFWPARMARLMVQPGFYPSAAAFAYMPAVLQRFLKVLSLTAAADKAETNARMTAFSPGYITGYASALEALAREQREGRLDLRGLGTLKQITNVAEPLSPHARAAITDAFGVHVSDEYAMGECLALSSGCMAGVGSHINSDFAIVEVVDRNNKPVPSGTEGDKILITNLYNTVQPFIRYEIDDRIVIASEPCSCGSFYPKIARISGRDKDTLWFLSKDGPRALPYYVMLMEMHHELDIAEHQIEQTGINKYVFRAAPVPGRQLSVERIKMRIDRSLQQEGIIEPLSIDIEIVSDIPRGPSGKAVRAKNSFGPPDRLKVLKQKVG